VNPPFLCGWGLFVLYFVREHICSVRQTTAGRDKPWPTQNNWKKKKPSIEEIAMEAEAPKRVPILELAWQNYARLELSASRRARGFYRLRRWIAGLGILAILLAIITQQFFPLSPDTTEPASQDYAILGFAIKVLFVAIPIMAAAFVAFGAGLTWASAVVKIAAP
jgi:hypothetical protein